MFLYVQSFEGDFYSVIRDLITPANDNTSRFDLLKLANDMIVPININNVNINTVAARIKVNDSDIWNHILIHIQQNIEAILVETNEIRIELRSKLSNVLDPWFKINERTYNILKQIIINIDKLIIQYIFCKVSVTYMLNNICQIYITEYEEKFYGLLLPSYEKLSPLLKKTMDALLGKLQNNYVVDAAQITKPIKQYFATTKFFQRPEFLNCFNVFFDSIIIKPPTLHTKPPEDLPVAQKLRGAYVDDSNHNIFQIMSLYETCIKLIFIIQYLEQTKKQYCLNSKNLLLKDVHEVVELGLQQINI